MDAYSPEKRRERYLKYRERHLEACVNWNKNNPDKVKAYQRKYRTTDEFKSRRRDKRKVLYALDGSKERADNKARRLRLRDAVIAHYGGKCVCCGEANKGFLTIDHIDGEVPEMIVIGRKLGNWQLYAYLVKYGFPAGYQLMCANCNMAIGWWGVCPHKKDPY